ncbi:MAG TPA: leucyl aminopeptidase, partial [Flavobacterium sp.]|nr:leucyl aminopeptidase [Flavobacterium sp.]
MKTNTIQDLGNFSGTILIPVFESEDKNSDTIVFDGLPIPSKIFSGIKDTLYLVEKNNNIHLFVGLGKTIDYKGLKTIFRRIAAKQKEHFSINVALVLPEQFTDNQVEAMISGLLLGTYDLGHFKANKKVHPFIEPDFTLHLVSDKDHLAVAKKGIKIAKAQLAILNLVDLPSNTVNPKYLAHWAKEKGDV